LVLNKVMLQYTKNRPHHKQGLSTFLGLGLGDILTSQRRRYVGMLF
jgi:hypothetical protein